MPLSDTAIKQSKPQDMTFRLYDTAGLYLEVAPRGGKWWRLKYRVSGRFPPGTVPPLKLL
ncbi:MAG: DUF4102 domain-containing protein [Magnetococcales bacterium]|nr:DUF4102 domain-containing protein [Magnetococcales bacterium]